MNFKSEHFPACQKLDSLSQEGNQFDAAKMPRLSWLGETPNLFEYARLKCEGFLKPVS